MRQRRSQDKRVTLWVKRCDVGLRRHLLAAGRKSNSKASPKIRWFTAPRRIDDPVLIKFLADIHPKPRHHEEINRIPNVNA